ncbi:hypothetical protein BJ742DRAFT_149267 [Cladochytrium replicatum]|nr:hypothetical protein BJ742DRAFT_149267 [Cladochytrium replicatum]
MGLLPIKMLAVPNIWGHRAPLRVSLEVQPLRTMWPLSMDSSCNSNSKVTEGVTALRRVENRPSTGLLPRNNILDLRVENRLSTVLTLRNNILDPPSMVSNLIPELLPLSRDTQFLLSKPLVAPTMVRMASSRLHLRTVNLLDRLIGRIVDQSKI